MANKFRKMNNITIEESDCWKNDLIQLMQDFYIPQSVINRIIRTAERKAKPKELCKETYQRGWFMFKEYLLQQ